MQDKIRVRRMMNRESQNFSHKDKTGNNMVQLRNRNSINLQIFHFRHGVPTPTRVQFAAQLLQMQTPGRCGRCRGENYINAGMHISRRDRTTQLIKCTP